MERHDMKQIIFFSFLVLLREHQLCCHKNKQNAIPILGAPLL